MVDHDVGIVGRRLVHDLAPQAARRHDVRLVDAREATAPAARQLEGEPHHAPDLVLVVDQRVDGTAALGGRRLLRRTPEVDAASELAHDQQVDIVEALGAQRRCVDERPVDRDRPEVREQSEPAAKREQRLLRTDRRVRVGPGGPTHRAEEDRVRPGAHGNVLVADGGAIRVDRGTADRQLVPPEGEPGPLGDRLEHGARGADHLRSDAVARDHRDVERRARGLSPQCAFGACYARTARVPAFGRLRPSLAGVTGPRPRRAPPHRPPRTRARRRAAS
jgi:hypothetical protein